jgi:hypothetical protein
MITKEMFLNAELNKISRVYYGKNRGCRCGCLGYYTSTSFCAFPCRDSINDLFVLRQLNRAKKIVLKGCEVDFGTTYVNVVTGKNTALCFYFDDIKG